MKRACPFVMAALLASWRAFFAPGVGAQPPSDTAYIIVHAHNPEGIEIGSIEGISPWPVRIYDGDDFVGDGPSSVETHNKPVAIPAGTHTIKAKFNGITQQQTVTIGSGDTKVVTFTFGRNSFDLVAAIESVSTVMTDSFVPPDNGTTTSRYDVATPTGHFQWDACRTNTPPVPFSATVSVSIAGDMITITASGQKPEIYPEFGISSVRIYAPYPMWGTALYAYREIDFSSPNNFDQWIVQCIYPNLGTNAMVNISEWPEYSPHNLTHNLTPWAWYSLDPARVGQPYTLWLGNKRKHYVVATAIQRQGQGALIYDNTYCCTGSGCSNYVNSNPVSERMGLSGVKMASVPYDLLGTGVGGPGKKPPVASFANSPEHPSVAEQIVFDASASYDPDGAIVQYGWAFGDGNYAQGQRTSHAYAEAGDYTVTLTVTDNDGLTDSTSRPVRVEQSPPRIEEIIITPQQDPMTRHDVTFEARISDAPGYLVWAIDWLLTDAESGRVDLYSSGSNPYTTQPAAGTHGKKKVICTIFYRNISTGRGGVDSEHKEFLLFFDKYQLAFGQWDPKRVPNWFVYWARDGAVPSIVSSGAEYDAFRAGYGGYDPNTDRIYLRREAAEQHYPCVVKLETHFGTEKFGGPDVTGIDCAAEAVAHELYHKWVNRQWKTGVFSEPDHDRGLEAPDCDDELPDFYETETSFTSNSDTDTYDLEHKKSCNGDILDQYRRYGDQEYMAMSAAKGAKGDKERDWANPGKQTSVRKFLLPSERRASGVATFSQKSVPETRFTGTYSDHGTDTNGNGLYDYLTVLAGVDIAAGGYYDLISTLTDADGNTIGLVNEPHTFEAGTNEVELNFDGTLIHHFRVDGPYELSLTLTDDDGNEIRSENNAYLTSPYSYTAFEGEQIWFTGNYSDHPTDTDADGVYDYLTVEVETNTTIPGDYTVRGYLYDDSENPIGFASTSTYADIGTLTTQLNFPGLSIGLAGKDGPYIVRYLALGDGRDMPLDFVLDAYTTAAYDHTDFRPTEAAFGDVFSDHGQDTNGDGLLEFLIVEVLVDVTVPRNYTLAGYLYDLDNKEVVWATTDSYLDAGLQSVVVSFDGPGIFTHGVNGPYEFRYAVLYDENGSLSDILSNPYTTSSYSYTDFQRPEASAFRVAGLGRLANGRLRLDFSTVLGGAYHLEVCDSLVGSTWVQTPFFDTEGGTEAQESIQGSGAVLSIYVSPTGNRAFYRIAGP